MPHKAINKVRMFILNKFREAPLHITYRLIVKQRVSDYNSFNFLIYYQLIQSIIKLEINIELFRDSWVKLSSIPDFKTKVFKGCDLVRYLSETAVPTNILPISRPRYLNKSVNYIYY